MDPAAGNASNSDSQSGTLPERAKAIAIQLLSGLLVRTIIVFLAAALIIALIVDVAYPSFTTSTYNKLTVTLAEDARQQSASQGHILQLMQQHDLAWYYITDADGKITTRTSAFCPHLPPGPTQNVSRQAQWNGKNYWESVAPVDGGSVLHVGFYISPVVFSQLGSPFAMTEPCPTGLIILIFMGVLCAVLAMLFYCVCRPAGELVALYRSAIVSRDPAAPHLDLAAAVFDIKQFVSLLEDARQLIVRQKPSGAAPAAAPAMVATPEVPEDQRAATRVSEFYSRDAEEEFINVLIRELDTIKSSHHVCQRVLDKLNDKYPTSLIYGAIFKSDGGKQYLGEAFLGFDDRTMQNLKRIDHSRIAGETFSVGSYLNLDTQAVKDYGLQPVFSALSIKSAVYLPLSFQARNLGMLAIYFTSEGKTVQDRLRFLRNVVGVVSRALYEVMIYEEELLAALTDPLTGVRNRKFLQDMLPRAFARSAGSPETSSISIVLMEGDHFKDIVETCGAQTSEVILKELARTISSSVRTTDGDGRAGPGDYLIRYGGEQFIILMENTDAARAGEIGERVRVAVSQKHDWSGGITRWSISIGVATYPADAKTPEDLLGKADTAVSYVKEALGRNKVCHIKQVPETYKAAKESAAIGGELGVFDPAALLQSLSTAQKTGILTVTDSAERQLWVLFENGKLIQAKLGKFKGAQAIVEFVVTFEEGSFSFQDKVFGPKETITKLPRLDEAFNVARSLERCLMDGALAQDNYNAAKAIISSSHTIIRPIAPVEFSARWQALSQLPDPPTQQEFNIMSDIVQQSDGKTTLTEIFLALDTVPTAQLWRSAALLVQHGLVSKKPVVTV